MSEEIKIEDQTPWEKPNEFNTVSIARQSAACLRNEEDRILCLQVEFHLFIDLFTYFQFDSFTF